MARLPRQRLAPAFENSQGEDSVPIPGTKRRRYLEENVAALEIELSDEELARLAAAGTARGERYADMSRING